MGRPLASSAAVNVCHVCSNYFILFFIFLEMQLQCNIIQLQYIVAFIIFTPGRQFVI